MAEEEEVRSFKDIGVNEQLAEACDNLGWKCPTKIQVETIPLALEGKDIIGLAQTGSGKTGAFAIPILQSLLETPKQTFFACVLSPTRELAIQIAEQFEALGSGIGVKCAVLVGGVDQVQQSIALGKRPHIVVATPGRLLDHLTNTKGFSLRTLKYLVLDEADRLLNDDFEKSLDDLLNVIPRDRRTYLFSATMTNKHITDFPLQKSSAVDPKSSSDSQAAQVGEGRRLLPTTSTADEGLTVCGCGGHGPKVGYGGGGASPVDRGFPIWTDRWYVASMGFRRK